MKIYPTVPDHISRMWGHSGPYNEYSKYLRRTWGRRIQKISVDLGTGCPREKASTGCKFCNQRSFLPPTSIAGQDVDAQIDCGISVFRDKYPDQKYAVYFQAGNPTAAASLARAAEIAFGREDVVCLIVASRPDTLRRADLEALKRLAENHQKTLEFELGLESTIDKTLARIDRGHTHSQSIRAVELLADLGVACTAHLIFGLPGEGEDEFFRHRDELNRLPICGVKLHNLQIVRGAALEAEYAGKPFALFSPESYLEFLCRWLSGLRPDMLVQRFTNDADPSQVVAPDWGRLKNHAFSRRLEQELLKRGIYQGQDYAAADRNRA